MKWINLAIGSVIVLFSCHDRSRPPDLRSFRDTVAKAYLRGIDSLQGFDTTEANYLLLKAYIKNDSNFLVQFQKKEDFEKQFQHQWDTGDGKIINEYDKHLTMKDWNDFKKAMVRADFWGLKKSNGEVGVDGDDITVSGYIKGDTSYQRPAKFSLVRRWLVHATTLGEPFDLALLLSGNRQGCFTVSRDPLKHK